MDHHEPLISCSIPSCTCGCLHEKRREQSQLHEFLMGLNPDFYGPLRTQILSQEPLPSLDRAYQLVTQEERVRTSRLVVDHKPPDVLGFAVRTEAVRVRGSSERPLCSKCNKLGHEASRSWADTTCGHCKKRGHDSSYCYEVVGYPDRWFAGKKSSSRGRGQVCANVTSSSSSNMSIIPFVSAFGQTFTAEQWKAISEVIGNTNVLDNRLNGKFHMTSWIIDTGATHHVTGSWLGCLILILLSVQ